MVEHAKSEIELEGGIFQAARLTDVFLLGPFMLWFAARSEMPDWARLVLAVSGAMTMAFNLRNYVLVDRVRLQGEDCRETLMRLT